MSGELPEELPPGFQFGAYVIHACIGRGGMARVYRAEQAALNRSVALKVLDRWVLDEPTGMERFVREARAAASIKHPNVVDILDVGVWRERPYIVMEMLVGCDLQSYLDRFKTLSDGEVAKLALPVIAGVMAVHEAGVVHRDLKPSNIFLSNGPEGEVIPKVLDFGVSKFSNNLMDPIRRATKTREIVGTPAYMAPEALNGVRELGPAADQYALGAVLYECTVGRPPFEGETLLELLKAVAVGKIDPPRVIRPEISPVLERAILRAISSDPGARFETLRDLGRALWPLADARTRTIWEPSFGAALVPAAADENEHRTLVTKRPPSPESPLAKPALSWRSPIIGRAVLFGLAAAGAVGAVFAFGGGLSRDPVATPVTQSPSDGSRRDLEARGAEGRVGEDSARGEAQPPAPVPPHGSDADESATSSTRTSNAGTGRGNAAPRRSTVQARSRAPAPRQRASRSDPETAVLGNLPSSDLKTPPRADLGDRTSSESELDGLFIEPRDESRRPVAQGSEELDGMFRESTAAPVRGANDAPIPD